MLKTILKNEFIDTEENNINICHNELVNDGFIDDDDDKDKNNAIAENIIYYDGFIADD